MTCQSRGPSLLRYRVVHVPSLVRVKIACHDFVVCITVCKIYVPNYLVVVVTSTRMIKSAVTGQAPVTLKPRNILVKNTNNPKVVHPYITADAIHASTRNI